mmetsp:Transcript_20425/g.40179  ORF Transcript_20425/g.40179 Transcript_20425/m.40179 type:complete len:111 (+) Transcript_20425:772-1104(+)
MKTINQSARWIDVEERRSDLRLGEIVFVIVHDPASLLTDKPTNPPSKQASNSQCTYAAAYILKVCAEERNLRVSSQFMYAYEFLRFDDWIHWPRSFTAHSLKSSSIIRLT